MAFSDMPRRAARFVAAAFAVVVAAGVAFAAEPSAAPVAEQQVVASITDGDTLRLRSGARVRLLQIDTPELGGGECYSRAAATELRRLAPPGARVQLAVDPRLDRVDAYGRLLRYVFASGKNVNLELVRRGAATPYFYRGERGRYARALLVAAQGARRAKRGLWRACPRAALNPAAPATTGTSGAATPKTPQPVTRTGCDPAYPTVCIAPPPPDLDCGEIPHRNFRVLPPDPHGFDGNDGDGIGCEG